MDLRQAIAKLFSARVFLSVLEFTAIAGFTQLLGVSAMGSFFLFQLIIGLVGIPGGLGISKAAEKDLSADEPTGEVVYSSILLKFILLSPWIVILFLFREQIGTFVGLQGIGFLVIYGLVANQYRRLSIRLLAGQMRIEETAVIRVIGKITWIAVAFGGIYLSMGEESILIGFISGDLVVILISTIRLDTPIELPNIERMRSLATFGRFVFIRSVGAYTYSWMDVAILRFFVPPSIIGAYEIAWRVASLSMMLTNAIRESLFPEISRLYTQGSIDEISDILYRLIQPPIYVTIPALAGSIVLGKDILAILFSPEATVAYSVLLIFMVEKVFRSLHMILSPTLFAIEQPELGYRGSVVAIIVNLGLNVLLVPFFGIHGAAVATAVSAMVSMGVNLRYLSRFVSLRIPWSRMLWSIVCSILMGLVVYILVSFYPDGLFGLVLGVATGVVLYAGSLLSYRNIRSDVRSAIS